MTLNITITVRHGDRSVSAATSIPFEKDAVSAIRDRTIETTFKAATEAALRLILTPSPEDASRDHE